MKVINKALDGLAMLGFCIFFSIDNITQPIGWLFYPLLGAFIFWRIKKSGIMSPGRFFTIWRPPFDGKWRVVFH
ncbi:MAG: hypothetical protein CEN89_158 [Candidatus Berkelbacteria bacterium Licking1014_7]|uniref:Uncharacterized protein n=1 Tax=Candidatus Berkelbacteria bacterium Licking1014_7 TaxID=2017147 RepID=A0A554LK89_9BACT|nr:MAG: hypothetical protein CEN89_158 [Candidatus Berkelbacteria bacterium Licking1014_7]